MTANQIAWSKELETERANRENENLQRQKIAQAYQEMWLNYNLGLQSQAIQREQIQSKERISLNEISSRERMDYFNRQANWEIERNKNVLNTRRLVEVEIPKTQSDITRNTVRNSVEIVDSVFNKIMQIARPGAALAF